ncbi:MAG: cupin domain-containing protein [Pirellulales bacterium]|nr:cupin domain-containing protein [Pirellulales bacterium]
MPSQHPIGDPTELAELYVVGAMNHDEFTAFEAHLAEGCPLCKAELRALEALTTALATVVPSEAPPPRVRETLLARVSADSRQELDEIAIEAAMTRQLARQQAVAAAEDAAAASLVSVATSSEAAAPRARREPGWYVTHGAEDEWVSIGASGVSMRVLFVDPRRRSMTCLMRVPPGASIPGHMHQGAEECLVLEGALRVGDVILEAGDFQRTAPGFSQPDQSSASGCVLLLTSPFE